jgi:hypothetical protein
MTEQPVDYTFWLEQGMVGLLQGVLLAARR